MLLDVHLAQTPSVCWMLSRGSHERQQLLQCGRPQVGLWHCSAAGSCTAQLQHLLPAGRALEPQPAAVLRTNKGTRLIADVRVVLQHPSHPAGPSQAGSASHRRSRGLLRRDGLLPWQKRGTRSWSGCWLTAKDAHAKRYSTRYSRVVTQRSTDLAQSSLPSVIGRERGYSGWYDRSMA